MLRQLLCLLFLGITLPSLDCAHKSRVHNINDLGVLKTLLDKRAISPEQQRACSAYYFPRMEAISNDYSDALDLCKETAENAYELAISKTKYWEIQIQEMSGELCNQICEANFLQNNDYLQLFECYNTMATAGVSTLFRIEGNATLARIQLNADIERIDAEEIECMAIAFETYQINWNAEAQLWNACVAGKDDVTTVVTTATPFTTTSTTTTRTTTTTPCTTPTPLTTTTRTTTTKPYTTPTPLTTTTRTTTTKSYTTPTPLTTTLCTTTTSVPTPPIIF